VKIEEAQQKIKIEGQQKIKIIRTNRQSNLQASCQSIFSLCRHHPSKLLEPNVVDLGFSSLLLFFQTTQLA